MIKKKTVLHVRMTPEKRQLIEDLAKDYEMETSEFVRRVFDYISQQRPIIPLAPVGKGPALATTISRN